MLRKKAHSFSIVVGLPIVQSASFARRYANSRSIWLSQVGSTEGNAIDEMLASV